MNIVGNVTRIALTLLVVPFANPVLAATTSANGPAGGHILYGPVSGVKSRAQAFKAGIHQLHGGFDGSPKLLRAVSSKDGNVLIVAFRAALHGAPVAGLALTTYDPAGNSSSAVLYDSPGHLAKSLPAMLRSLKANTQAALVAQKPTGGSGKSGPDFAAYEAAALHVELKRVAFPDGTATIGIAPGFTPVNMSGGKFAATAPDGAYANLYIPVPLMDPNGSLYQQEMRMSGGQPPQIPGQVVLGYEADPVAAWKKLLTAMSAQRGEDDPSPQVLLASPLGGGSGFTGKKVAGTMTFRGEPFVFSGLLVISPPPGADGGWQLQITMRGAPAAHAATDMPALIAMQRSEKVDMDAVRDQTMRNIAAMAAETSHWLAANKAAGDAARDRAFNTSMHNAQVAQDNIDRSAAGFIDHISDSAVLANDPTGAHGRLDAGLADALVKADPQNFHVVPMTQYRAGVDY